MSHDDLTTYAVERLARGRISGLTRPFSGLLRAIVKMDSEEVPTCAYNEYAALRLGRSMGAPIAEGVPIVVGPRVAFASLEVALPGTSLPNLHKGRLDEIVRTYPEEAAALLLFDIWVGNWDRGQNVKVSLLRDDIRIFRAFDHSHCLLSVSDTSPASTTRLKSSDPIVRAHPFLPYVSDLPLEPWLKRLESVPDILVFDACCSGTLFINVTSDEQSGLAHAMIIRRDSMSRLLSCLL